jgi:hypothetical protein
LLLYPKNASHQLEQALFRSPAAEYRGTPFWAWNCRLDRETLLEQIEIFKQMGFGGFHIHARAGLDTPYLGDEFMQCVKLCDQKAISEGMLCWLYDEDRFPSGFAGGIVTRDVSFRQRYLLLSTRDVEKYAPSRAEFDRLVENGEKPAGYYLASYNVELENGRLKSYRTVERGNSPKCGRKWHAYVALAAEDPYYNNQTYLDVLNPKAVARFIEVTHERYFEAVGSEFGKFIPAIFTDEPQLSRKWTLPVATCDDDVTMPFTDDLPETYSKQYGTSLLDVLPELFWELPDGKVSVSRYRYHDHLTDRFAAAFSCPASASSATTRSFQRPNRP